MSPGPVRCELERGLPGATVRDVSTARLDSYRYRVVGRITLNYTSYVLAIFLHLRAGCSGDVKIFVWLALEDICGEWGRYARGYVILYVMRRLRRQRLGPCQRCHARDRERVGMMTDERRDNREATQRWAFIGSREWYRHVLISG